jgi:hypothetical protein
MELIEKDLYNYSNADLEILRLYYNFPISLSKTDLIHAIAELNSINLFMNSDMSHMCPLTLRFDNFEAICLSNNQFSTWIQRKFNKHIYKVIPIPGIENREKLVIDNFDKSRNEFRAVLIHKTTDYDIYLFLGQNPESEFREYIINILNSISTSTLMENFLSYHPDIIDMMYSRIQLSGPIYEKIYTEFDSNQDIVNCLLNIEDCVPGSFSQTECISHILDDVIHPFLLNAKLDHMESFIQAISSFTLN